MIIDAPAEVKLQANVLPRTLPWPAWEGAKLLRCTGELRGVQKYI